MSKHTIYFTPNNRSTLSLNQGMSVSIAVANEIHASHCNQFMPSILQKPSQIKMASVPTHTSHFVVVTVTIVYTL